MPKRPKTTTDPVELQQGFHCLICNLTPDGSLMLPISGEGWPESLKTAIEEEEMAGWVNKDHFILWYLNKGVQFYQTRDGKPITTLADIKRMWAEIRGEVTPKKVQAYLFPQHEDILKKLESTAPLAEGKALETPQRSNEASEEYDVFLCHASEDKDSFVRPLAQTLRDRGLRVWYDEFSLKLGDGLRESIERGLKKSRYGVIVLSKNFFCKEWPQKELNGLFYLESGEKKILPVWHEVNKKEVTEYSPILANRVAIKTSKGLTDVAEKIIEVACIGAS